MTKKTCFRQIFSGLRFCTNLQINLEAKSMDGSCSIFFFYISFYSIFCRLCCFHREWLALIQILMISLTKYLKKKCKKINLSESLNLEWLYRLTVYRALGVLPCTSNIPSRTENWAKCSRDDSYYRWDGAPPSEWHHAQCVVTLDIPYARHYNPRFIIKSGLYYRLVEDINKESWT